MYNNNNDGITLYRIAFSGAVTELGLNGHFRPYSLRRGGATHHFLVGGQLDKTTDRGRWGNTRTARIYINTSLADLSQQQQCSIVNSRTFALSTHFVSVAFATRKGSRGEWPALSTAFADL